MADKPPTFFSQWRSFNRQFWPRWLFLMRQIVVEMLAGAAAGVLVALMLGHGFGTLLLTLFAALGSGIGTWWGLRRKGLWPGAS